MDGVPDVKTLRPRAFTEEQRRLFAQTAALTMAREAPLLTTDEARRYGVADPVAQTLAIIADAHRGLPAHTLASCREELERRCRQMLNPDAQRTRRRWGFGGGRSAAEESP